LKEQHWAYDIGADLMTLDLTRAFQSTAVLATFSRLLIDPNRPLDSDTLIRTTCDNKQVALNCWITEEDLDNRISNYYTPYRKALKQMLEKNQTKLHISIHSFTPVYEGNKRSVEIGVLHTSKNEEDVETVKKVHNALKEEGFDTRFNDPYEGSIIDVFNISQDLHIPSFCLEFRQDLIIKEDFRRTVVNKLQKILLYQ